MKAKNLVQICSVSSTFSNVESKYWFETKERILYREKNGNFEEVLRVTDANFVPNLKLWLGMEAQWKFLADLESEISEKAPKKEPELLHQICAIPEYAWVRPEYYYSEKTKEVYCMRTGKEPLPEVKEWNLKECFLWKKIDRERGLAYIEVKNVEDPKAAKKWSVLRTLNGEYVLDTKAYLYDTEDEADEAVAFQQREGDLYCKKVAVRSFVRADKDEMGKYFGVKG